MDLEDTLNMPGSSTPAATLVGRFLVAAPSMPDERFQKSVVFICKHDDEGALGIIVNNKVEDLALGQVYKQLGIDGPKTANLQPVLFGGPVETVFSTLAIPCSVEGRARLGSTPLGYALLSLLRFAWAGAGRSELYAYLRSPYSGIARTGALAARNTCRNGVAGRPCDR